MNIRDYKQTDNEISMQMKQKKSDLSEQESKSLALDLETLNAEYKNLLVRYKQAVLDYTDDLNQEASKPCSKYNENSTDIDQACYEEIWKSAGCTTTGFTTNPDQANWAKSQTLNQLIYDSFLWATTPDQPRRTGCYGSYQSPYLIIGVGTNGYIYRRNGLESEWTQINDNGYNIKSICTNNDGKGIIVSTGTNQIFSKTNFDDPEWRDVQNNCCVFSVAMGQDGTLIGIGTDHQLWSKPSLEGNWTKTASTGEWMISICIAPDGTLFCIGGDNSIWKKNSYLNLTSQNWEYLGGNNHVISITIAPDGTFIGVGTDNQLYSKDSYKDLTTNWKGPHNSSCCVVGITTIANPEYDANLNSGYSTAKEPNYNINAKKYTIIQGQSFWGSKPISQVGGLKLNECMASVASTPGATGATFNKDKVCFLRGGDGLSIPSAENDFSIVPKSQQLLKVVETVSADLKSVNEKMQKKIDRVREIYGNQVQDRDVNNYDLIGQHDKLQKERKVIQDMLKQYQNLENEESEAGLFVTQNYYGFFLLFLISIIFIIILAFFSTDQTTAKAISDATNSATKASVATAQTTTKMVNPIYVLFGIILLFTISYIYNQYFQSVYNNLPSFKNLSSESNMLYFFIFILVAFGIGSRFI